MLSSLLFRGSLQSVIDGRSLQLRSRQRGRPSASAARQDTSLWCYDAAGVCFRQQSHRKQVHINFAMITSLRHAVGGLFHLMTRSQDRLNHSD